MVKAFISYSTKDKVSAGLLQQDLSNYNINAFLAHEDLEVSDEWREEIIINLKKCSLFICLLSQHYLQSEYCMQEAGMAVITNKAIIPLSLDGTTSPAFLAKFQSKKIYPQNPTIRDIIKGLLKRNREIGINIIIDMIGFSGSFKSAETNFTYLEPYIDDLTDVQAKLLIKKMLDNGQVYNAHKCVTMYFPQIFKEYKKLMTQKQLIQIRKNCRSYNISIK